MADAAAAKPPVDSEAALAAPTPAASAAAALPPSAAGASSPPAAAAASASSAEGAEGGKAAAAWSEGGATDDAEKELEEMKARMKAIEEEAAKIEAMQSQIEESLKPQTGGGSEADARSIFLGNVDYSTTPEDLEEYFQSCGAINRITIPTDKFTGMSKGFAYIEFKDAEAVNNALLLNGVDFKGRPLKIVGKRTNVPGLRGRGRGRGRMMRPPPRGYYGPFRPRYRRFRGYGGGYY